MFYVQATHPGGSVWLGGIMEMLVLVRKGFGLWVFGGYTCDSKASSSPGRSARGVSERVEERVVSETGFVCVVWVCVVYCRHV